MTRYTLEPEVAGSIGQGSNVDFTVHPPKVKALQYVFAGWLGDPIVESFPCFLVSVELGRASEAAGLSGFALAPVDVQFDEQFVELFPETAAQIPEWAWLRVTGTATDDFALHADHRLVLSRRALDLALDHGLKHCIIEELEPGA